MSLKRTTVQIRDDQHAALKELVRPGQSLSSILRKIIDDYFQDDLSPGRGNQNSD